MPTTVERLSDPDEYNAVAAAIEEWGLHTFAATCTLLNWKSEDKQYRFDREKRRLSVSGLSDEPGNKEAINRVLGLIGGLGAALASTLAFYLLALSLFLPESGLGMTASIVGTTVAAALIFSAMGSVLAGATVECVDHTTARMPDDLDDLKQQFVDGDLDDTEFERQLEDRLTEVDG